MSDSHRSWLDQSARVPRALRALALACAVMIGGASTSNAQGLGYVVAGLAGFSGFYGSSASSVHAAGGAEGLVAGRFGFAGEVGAFANTSSALLVASVNGAFHASSQLSDRRVVPFVTAGYSHFGSGDGSFSAWNAGVGRVLRRGVCDDLQGRR